MIVKSAETQAPIGGFEELAGMITDFWETDESLPRENFPLCRPVHLRGSGCRMESKLQTAEKMERIQEKLKQEDSGNPIQLEELLSWDLRARRRKWWPFFSPSKAAAIWPGIWRILACCTTRFNLLPDHGNDRSGGSRPGILS